MVTCNDILGNKHLSQVKNDTVHSTLLKLLKRFLHTSSLKILNGLTVMSDETMRRHSFKKITRKS